MMKLARRAVLALIAFSIVSSLALMQEAKPNSAAKMANAAQKFLASLSPELKAKASFPFDSKERLTWYFTPRQDKQKNPTRIGVRFEELSAEQIALALELLKSGTSDTGYKQATTIMSLESILRDLEKAGAMVRNPNWYFVSIYGTPALTGSWGWRIEGHHMSISFRIDDGQVTSATPFFFGANPAHVKAGDRKGLRTLPEVEDLARELFDSLTPEQRKLAHQAQHFPEIKEQPMADPGEPVGLVAAQLDEGQRGTLRKLLLAYTQRMPADVGAMEFARVENAGWANIRIAYSGSTEPGKPYTYRIHGPTFLVEFLNVQADSAGNPANHIHSVWRTLPIDFGEKLK